MRVYFLKLESSDFVAQTDTAWTTDTIDLYRNNSFYNYSTTKSNYGTNLLGNDTWTGLNQYSPTTTDSGIVSAGRFIDTSGRIDLVSYSEDIINQSGTATIASTLTVFSTHDPSSYYPSEWVQSTEYTTGSEIEIIDCNRYVRIQASFDATSGVNFAPTIYVRVEIDQPVMSPLYNGTKSIINKFPSWMAVREKKALELATPELATPNSLMGKFINAISGEWLEDLNSKLTYSDLQRYIGTADLNQKAWIYKTHADIDFVYSVTGDGTSLARSADLIEFSEAIDEDALYWDEEENIIYSNKLYTNFKINGTTYTQQGHQVWNTLDELGLLVDLGRLYLESNANYRLRILDVYANPVGVGADNIKFALRRELDIWRAYGSTPASIYLGATPEILEITDIEKDSTFVDYEGIPTDKFRSIIDDNANKHPVTWGKFKWNKAVWDVGGESHRGFSTLPYRLDSTPYIEDDTQSGVGDGNDILAFHPSVITGPRDVNFRLRARGKKKTDRTEYPPVELEFNIYGQGTRTVYNNPNKLVWLTIEIKTVESGTPTYYYSFQIANKSNVDVDKVTSTSQSTLVFMDDDGTGTDKSLAFAKKTTGVAYNNTGIIPNSIISSVTLKNGKWDVSSQTYLLAEISDTFVAYFSHDISETLVYNTSVGAVPSYGFNTATPSTLPRPRVLMSSKVVSSSTQTWVSVKTPYKIVINNTAVPTGQSPVTIAVPTIIFDPYVSDPSKQYVVELVTSDTNGILGAYATNQNDSQIFLNYTYIKIQGSNTWISNQHQTFSKATTPTLTFSIGSGGLYPIINSIYELFEANQITPFLGTIDENGPYKNDTTPKYGNTNFTLTTLNPQRADFGIPNNDTYIINWMGVDVIDDSRTIAWLDSNTVNPAFPVDDVTYPLNAIVETFASGNYSYGPISIKARLKTDPDIEWFPQIHSGYFYQNQDEYYLFAEPQIQLLTSTPTSFNLAGGTYQGAPIIVRSAPDYSATPVTFRQLAPTYGMIPNAATPNSLNIEYSEERFGSGNDFLYAAYEDIYNIVVTNLDTGQNESLISNSTTTNAVHMANVTDRNTSYLITYKVTHSFISENENFDLNGNVFTKLTFDKSPADAGMSSYVVTYESSRFDPATPVNTPLNPQFTSMDEGFLFISFDEYSLDRIELYLSPSKIIADGKDYLVATIRSLDIYGNPKSNQILNLHTTFGIVTPSQVTTDRDGCAFATITSVISSSTPSGNFTAATIGNSFNVSETFAVSPFEARDGRLLAAVSADQIPADGDSQNTVVGKVEDGNLAPVSNAFIRWRKSRSLYEILNYAATPYYNGTTVADTNGIFNIGPFASATPDSGYWFVSMESSSASPSGSFEAVGDVVYWYEYPKVNYGAENFSGLPRPPIQYATPIWNLNYGGDIPPYSPINQFPSNYDEATPSAPATPNSAGGHVIWTPPKWFALPKYIQYQLGLLGDVLHKDIVDLSTALQKALKDKKWI